MSAPAIEAVDLVKRFGDFTAVDDVSFSVPAGTVFSMLGPNGAGKTTTVRMMTTLSSRPAAPPAWRASTSSPSRMPCATGWA